jgi:1,4-alpha-glucan branching enzyme
VSSAAPPGELAIVLHTHMPYVEGFGTWPFGEEWLWEAIATCYVPLLDEVFAASAGAERLTVSVTPVLADQLEVPDLGERFARFLADVREETHAADLRAAGSEAERAAIEHSLARYRAAGERMVALGGALLPALAPYVSWTSAATHAVLPLLATDAGIRLQLASGIASHRRRFGDWGGGFWLPECAHEPARDVLLEEAGVHATCVDLSEVLGSEQWLVPLRSAAGPLLVPLDRRVMDLVWSQAGYPSAGVYRDSFNRTEHDHHAHAVNGSVYDPEMARSQARHDARDFVARVLERVSGGGLCVAAFDTELFGHWWHEGPWWLAEVLRAADEAGLVIRRLDHALVDHPAVAAPSDLPITTWGAPRDLTTWTAPVVADIAVALRDAELRVVAAGAQVTDRAVRELLALQSSDWAFMTYRELSAPYAHERVAMHRDALESELRALGSASPSLRNLAPYAESRALLAL